VQPPINIYHGKLVRNHMRICRSDFNGQKWDFKIFWGETSFLG